MTNFLIEYMHVLARLIPSSVQVIMGICKCYLYANLINNIQGMMHLMECHRKVTKMLLL